MARNLHPFLRNPDVSSASCPFLQMQYTDLPPNYASSQEHSCLVVSLSPQRMKLPSVSYPFIRCWESFHPSASSHSLAGGTVNTRKAVVQWVQVGSRHLYFNNSPEVILIYNLDLQFSLIFLPFIL